MVYCQVPHILQWYAMYVCCMYEYHACTPGQSRARVVTRNRSADLPVPAPVPADQGAGTGSDRSSRVRVRVRESPFLPEVLPDRAVSRIDSCTRVHCIAVHSAERRTRENSIIGMQS